MFLGLDLSTSITGYTVLDENGNILIMSHINLTKYKNNLWKKIDVVQYELNKIKEKYNIKYIFIEEPLSKFKRGKSSAYTIGLLMRYSGIISYLIYKDMGMVSEYLPVSYARKLCRVILLPKRKAKGKDHKHQTFDQMSLREEFSGRIWPMKKTGKLKDFCYDEMDSYVIARAGFIQTKDKK